MEPNKHHGGSASGSDASNIPEQLRDRPSSCSQPGRPLAYEGTPLNVNAAPFQPQGGVLRGESSTANAMELTKHGGDPYGSGSDANNMPEQLRDRPSSSSQPWREGSPPYEGTALILDPYQPRHVPSGVNIWGPNAPGTPLPQPSSSDHGPPPGAAAIPPTPTIDQFRTLLLRGPRHPAVLIPPAIAARVVDLLARGDQDVLHWAVDAATTDVYMLMRSDTGHRVFAALLRASVLPSRYDLLRRIAREVASRGGSGSGVLMDVANNSPGEQSLKELICALTPHPEQCSMVIRRLLDDGMMEHWKGPNLLRNFFMLPPHYHSVFHIFIQFVHSNFGRLLSSQTGVGCLMACYMGARYRCHDLMLLENAIVINTSPIAQGMYSHRLLRGVLELGGYVHHEVADRVLMDLVALSTHQFGHLVVLACFQLTAAGRREEMLRRTLVRFRALDLDQLAVVVVNGYGRRVIRNLLLAGKRELPRNARNLAMRINELSEEDQQHADPELMKVVENAIW